MTSYSMDYYDLVNQIFRISQSIRYVGIYDSYSEKITDGFSPGTLQHLSIEEMQNSTKYDIKRWETYKLFERQLGQAGFAMVKYDKAILVTFPHGTGSHIRVSMEPDANYKDIIDRVQGLLVRNPVLK